MEKTIEFLKLLQKELQTQDHDCQVEPRFWVVMDYKKEHGNEDYQSGDTSYFHHDGDYTEFESLDDLKKFLQEHEYNEDDEELQVLLENNETDFDTLWEYVSEEYEYFDSCFMTEVAFIVPNTMFITKKEAKEHIVRNSHHYTSKAHTYAMSALRSPSVAKLWDILENFDWDSIK